jgi:hypothetical protein
MRRAHAYRRNARGWPPLRPNPGASRGSTDRQCGDSALAYTARRRSLSICTAVSMASS